MIIPKQKPQEKVVNQPDGEDAPFLGMDDLVDDPVLLAEMKSLEAASDEDFWKFEQSLRDE